MTDRKVCCAPGRDEEDGIDVSCGLLPHGPETDHYAVIIGRYLREPIGEMWWAAAPAEPHERILQIIADTVNEAKDSDGIGLNDVVARLSAEGFTRPSDGP
uniref:Uncharacterized protein n=1 Tax=Streptomyces sp. F12 TaxID=1436084 RepID=V9Z7Z3_9ACTN|nr:hypothetical protein [Streptomyces sp. F12]AHE40124.1 hypothetical protein pFRL6_37 [Streptomyces sp. F12]